MKFCSSEVAASEIRQKILKSKSKHDKVYMWLTYHAVKCQKNSSDFNHFYCCNITYIVLVQILQR
jgi:hypothetical protein